MIGDPFLKINVEVKLLQVCGPVLMAITLLFSLCLHEMYILVICMDDFILPQIVMLPLVIGLYDGIHLFFIGGVLIDDI
jgi:hypothetical protein